MKKVKMTTIFGHQTTMEVSDDSMTTVKHNFLDGEPFLINFLNKTIWINPSNIYFTEFENNVTDEEEKK